MRKLAHALLTSSMARAVKRPFKDAIWTIRGMTIPEVIVPGHARRIMFVCQGNICRSPLAQRLAARLFESRPGFEFHSAGVIARPGSEPPANAVAAALALGINLRGHRSRALDAGSVRAVDLIIVMEPWHATQVYRQFPDCAKPVLLMSRLEAGGPPRYGYLRYNIPDPYGRDRDTFESCFKRIETCLHGLHSRLI